MATEPKSAAAAAAPEALDAVLARARAVIDSAAAGVQTSARRVVACNEKIARTVRAGSNPGMPAVKRPDARREPESILPDPGDAVLGDEVTGTYHAFAVATGSGGGGAATK